MSVLNSENSSSEDEFYNVVDSLQHSQKPRLTKEDHELMNTYSYDKEPVKEWRQVSDFDALKECNKVKWDSISKLLGKCHGFNNSGSLFRNDKSKVLNLIGRILCDKGCYFFPNKCFMRHEYQHDLKSLMKKSLHDKFNPYFEKIFENCTSKNVTLELTEYGAPLLMKLAEDIGFNTNLDYDHKGVLKINFSLLTEEIWRHQTPCFVKEEKKILDVIHALLLSASNKHNNEVKFAEESYSQSHDGINDPVLKTMCHGPDYGVKEYSTENPTCDITKDEKNIENTGLYRIQHKNCSAFNSQDHWEYKHKGE